jgi:hypothetical protein
MIWKSLLRAFQRCLGIGRKKDINLGQETIEWLYHEQLKVDPEWSVRTENGFRWWADKNAQTIEIIGEETGPDGESGYLISVRTEFLRDVDLNDQSLAGIHEHLMSTSAMSGPVYDAESRTLSLCSLVIVHQEISAWMRPLISIASAMQIYEAKNMGAEMAKLLNAKEHVTGHPKHGIRPVPDEMAFLVEHLIAPFGEMPCKWPEREFQDVVNRYMQSPPAYGAKSNGPEFTVAFPCGDQWSICGVSEHRHPRYGNGILLLQSSPVNGLANPKGIRFALDLNGTELGKRPAGYGFGSNSYIDDMITFTCFLPNIVYKPGFLPNLFFSSALRAHEMALIITGEGWT